MNDRLELQEKRFWNVTVRTWKRSPDAGWKCAPWCFAIKMDGEKERNFGGVPNYCETRHKALMKAWYRAKWLSSGAWSQHYKPMRLPGD